MVCDLQLVALAQMEPSGFSVSCRPAGEAGPSTPARQVWSFQACMVQTLNPVSLRMIKAGEQARLGPGPAPL